jgi:hypothetical protein
MQRAAGCCAYFGCQAELVAATDDLRRLIPDLIDALDGDRQLAAA